MNFASTWNKLLKHCISADFWLVIGHVQGPLLKELRIAPFVSALKQFLWESLNDKFASSWNNLLKRCISANFLLMEG